MEPEQLHSCALRALTLCDGQVLEHPDRALTSCLCEALRRSVSPGGRHYRQYLVDERQDLIERTLAAPQQPLL